ncbi:LLM class F420-dependent oxidoreductase [Actinomadura sp. 21ATH]|uniref:LLM class F420-dependent oxidoreductase n=1 Tax=Actinomadura sp. 21ATH TaxID=1735444 RepID=UPI0035BF39B6
MRIGMALSYAGDSKETLNELADYERAGLDIVFVAETYSFDAVSHLGYIAAKTERLEIASGILPIYTRTPALTAMTAAGLDSLSEGRFTLGLGASGPQVIEGLHGVPFDAPLGRTREVIEICRKIWRHERLQYRGRYYNAPLPKDQGTGLGKPLNIVRPPVRASIPVLVAAIGPKNVEMTAEIANGWQPIFYIPERAADVWGDALAAGKARRDPGLGPLDVVALAPLAIGDDVKGYLEFGRPMAALFIGGMGAKGKNFYNDLARRYGFEKEAEEIQDLYLSGNTKEAAARIPAELLEKTSLIGSEGHVRERLAAMKESGITTVNVSPIAGDHKSRLELIEKIKKMAADL